MLPLERKTILLFRYLAGIAAVGSLAGSLLMFFLGLANIYKAYAIWLPAAALTDSGITYTAYSVIQVIESLDRFLIAIVLLYFGLGVYSIFIRTELSESDLGLPRILHIEHIGQLKQVVAEVIIVILFVLFLRHTLRVFQGGVEISLQTAASILVIPVCTTLLALALRLVEFHPKPARQVDRDQNKEPSD